MGIVKFKDKYRIDSTRLANWDYSKDGAYFITLCTNNREYYFGDIVNCELTDTNHSKISMECWLDLPNHYINCLLDKFVIMPNHVHGVIIIDNDRHKAGSILKLLEHSGIKVKFDFLATVFDL